MGAMLSAARAAQPIGNLRITDAARKRGLVSALVISAGTMVDLVTGQRWIVPTFTHGAMSQGAGAKSSTGLNLLGYFQRSVFTRVFISNAQTGGTGTISNSNTGAVAGAQIQMDSNGVIEFNRHNEVNYLNINTAGVSAGFGVAVVCGANAQKGYLNGKLASSRSGTVSFNFNGTGALFCTSAGSVRFDGTMSLHLEYDNALPDSIAAQLSANPWQEIEVVQAPTIWTATAVADTSLSGAATAVATASATLSTSIRLNGSAAAVAAAVGVLSTSIRMTGSAASVAAGSGSLTTSIRLTGAASSQASAAGSLTTAINLVANATSSASASGTLSGGAAQLTGAAAATAATSGALTTAIVLSGAAQAVATASAITAGGAAQLSGTASTSVTITGQVTTLINLNGAATSTAAATATFSGSGAQLSGAATASASASSMLTTAIALAGAVIAQASASAALVGQSVALTGNASTRASVSGVLSTGIGLAAAARAVSSGQAALTTQIAMVAIAQAQATAASDLSTRSQIDASMIPPGHIVSFASRSRVVTFRGKSRIVRF